MVALNMLISVYYAESGFFDDWVSYSFNCQITDKLDCNVYVYSQMEYCFKSPLKITSNGLNERKNVGPTLLNIYKYDNNYVKEFIFVVALR